MNLRCIRRIAPIALILAFTLTGCNGKFSSGIPNDPIPNLLTIKLSTSSLTLYPDNTTTVTFQATVISSTASTAPITVSLAGLVSGITASPSTLTLTNGNSGTFSLLASTTAGSATLSTADDTAINNSPSLTLSASVLATSGNSSSSTPISITIAGSNPNFLPISTDLPVIQITTAGGAAIDSEDTYVSGSLSITPGSANTTDSAYSGTMTVKGHGNSTWLMPKKPYKIKLDSKSKLLGMPSEKNWILLANYDDKSLLRNAAALYAGTLTSLAWSPRSRFVELYLNGQYEGNYELTEQVEIDKNRINITEMDDTDISGNAVTGGYLLEFDTANQPDDILFEISGVIFDLHDPDPAEPAQLAYIESYLQQASNALYSDNFTDPNTGYAQYLDSASFIDWYLVEELFKNNDAIDWSSCYMYKDMNNKLFMGPLWDFDIAAGNIDLNTNSSPIGWWIRSNPETFPQWTGRLFADPAFAAAVAARWNVLKPQFQTLPAWISQNAAALQLSETNNFQRWPILGQWVWPNSEVAGSYQGEVDFLNSWLTQRIAWMDSQFNAQNSSSAKKGK